MVKIEAKNLCYGYGNHLVLKGMSASFEPGQFTAIMGQNGSGKTTLIRCMSKGLNGYKGQILLDGHELTSYSLDTLAHKIAFVPQGQDTVFGATVFETILLGRLPFMTWAASDDDFKKVDQVIDQLKLSHLAHKSIHTISGGERQKVYIARAIAQDTPIIILDEPITYLDLKHQLEIMQILRNLSLSGVNVIMVVHDINLALRYCTNHIFIKDGHILDPSEPNQITESLIEEVFDVLMKKISIGDHPLFIP